jgi:hypothetical protein
MTVAYFDTFAGAAGDMIVASLLDAGADFDALRRELAKLGLEGYELSLTTVHRAGIAGRKFDVAVDLDHQPHRHLHHIVELIDAAGLAPRVADRAKRAFTQLARAEAKVHDTTVEKVHFHEVGAVDSILDVVGACVALELLGVDCVACSPIPLGSGTIQCDHGLMPLPAPATAELLAGFPTVPGVLSGEATTPTAAALLTTLCESIGPAPEMRLRSVGYGAGTREGDEIPNLLRVMIGEACASGETDSVVELATNLDDCTGEVLGAAIDALLSAGCLDAWAVPAVMKKSRPAWVLTVLCTEADVEAVEGILFSQTPTFGIRRRGCRRSTLVREHETVETPYGPVRVKVGRRGGRVCTASPEFADCRDAADSHHVAVREVYSAAAEAWRRGERR